MVLWHGLEGNTIMNVLTSFQIEFIRLLAKSVLQEKFFLTGGTALSEFYLQHRYSEDLDFFTGEEGYVGLVVPAVEEISSALQGKLEVKRKFKTFAEIRIERDQEVLKCDFAFDSPFRLAPTILNADLGIFVDNQLDIACNKLSALFDRNDIKDFVDIYFIDKEIIPFEKLLSEAKGKHIGLDNYWLTTALAKIENYHLLPRMIKPLSGEDLKEFFRQKALWLMSAPE
jgi:hypothetical protein